MVLSYSNQLWKPWTHHLLEVWFMTYHACAFALSFSEEEGTVAVPQFLAFWNPDISSQRSTQRNLRKNEEKTTNRPIFNPTLFSHLVSLLCKLDLTNEVVGSMTWQSERWPKRAKISKPNIKCYLFYWKQPISFFQQSLKKEWLKK